MKPTSEILKEARKLIEKPEGWTQEALARDVFGHTVSNFSPKAVCFCAVGAIQRVSKDSHEGELARRKLHTALHKLDKHCGIPSFNDNATHEQVLAMFDKAISLAETEEGLTSEEQSGRRV